MNMNRAYTILLTLMLVISMFSNVLDIKDANAQAYDIIVKNPTGIIYNRTQFMSFTNDMYGSLDYLIPSSSSTFAINLYKDGCTGQGFSITAPSTSSDRYTLNTSTIYNDHIFIALTNSTYSTYYYTNINYSVSGCTINLSTTNPTWSSTTTNISGLTRTFVKPVWISNTKYFYHSGIYDYATKTYDIKISNLGNHTPKFIPIRTEQELINIMTYMGNTGNTWYLYICKINISTYNFSCIYYHTGINLEAIGALYNSNNNSLLVQTKYTSGSNTIYELISYDLNTNTHTKMSLSNMANLVHTYGTPFIYTLKTTYESAFIPMIRPNGSISVIIYYTYNGFKYYHFEDEVYSDFRAPIGDLTKHQNKHILYASTEFIANLFDANMNLIDSISLSSTQVNTYNLIRFTNNIKYIQLLNTNTNQSIIYARDDLINTSNNIRYFIEPFFTTVVMTPITFARLDTNANYYYVEIAQNRPYKNMTQYYAKMIDQSSQVTVALRQTQCSYLILHEINKSSLEESTMNFMVCEDGISKTIEIPNTVNFVYAQDTIFRIHKTGTNDFNIGISSNKDINSEVKVTVCDVIDRALYDFENSTNEGVQITPGDIEITYPALSGAERAMKVYKNASGTYEYVFPLVRINKTASIGVYIEFSPQNNGGDTKTYTQLFLLRQYNSAKQHIGDYTYLNQSNYSGYSTKTYGSYTAYYRSGSIAGNSFDPNAEYVQFILRFTTSSAPYYNHLIQVYITTNVNQRVCHNYAMFTSMTANTIYTIEDNVRSILDKEIIIQYNNQLYSNTFYVNNKTSYSSFSNVESTFSNKIKGVFDEFSTRLVGNTDMSIVLFLAFMSMMFFSTVITRNIAVMYAIFILIVSITTYIYNTIILSMHALIILAFMAIALAIYYRYR